MAVAAPVLTKFNVKVFAKVSGPVDFRAFIPVFHRFIQEQKLGGLLVDVAEYTHVAQGPQVLLVAHEGQWVLDNTGGELGLVYSQRHAPGDAAASPEAALRRALKEALAGCAVLEAEPEAKSAGLTFLANDIEITANDRLAAPNDGATAALLAGLAFKLLLPGATPTAGAPADKRRRAFIRVKHTGDAKISPLLARL